MHHGSWTSSRSSAAASAVGASYSRFMSGAHSKSTCMSPARTVDGLAPVMSVNTIKTGTQTSSFSRRLRIAPEIIQTRIETCIPEMATA